MDKPVFHYWSNSCNHELRHRSSVSLILFVGIYHATSIFPHSASVLWNSEYQRGTSLLWLQAKADAQYMRLINQIDILINLIFDPKPLSFYKQNQIYTWLEATGLWDRNQSTGCHTEENRQSRDKGNKKKNNKTWKAKCLIGQRWWSEHGSFQ